MSPVVTVKRRVTATDVRAALRSVVAQHPGAANQPVEGDIPTRYTVNGRPFCLVAHILDRLGFSTGVLAALDAEHPIGAITDTGVPIAESQHPALRKIDPLARRLLAYIQDRADRGIPWERIAQDALNPSRWLSRWRDPRRKPWLAA